MFESIGLLVGETQGFDPAFVYMIVSALCGVIVTMATYIHRRDQTEKAELKAENAELKIKLAGYEDLAPRLIALVQEYVSETDQPTQSVNLPTRPSKRARVKRARV